MNNQANPKTPKTRKPLWRRILKWTFRVVVVLVVLVVLAWAIWSYTAARELGNEIDRIRAAGQPLTFAQLEASWKTVEYADDAGPLYAAAIDLFNWHDEADRAFKTGNEFIYEFPRAILAGKDVPPEMVAQVRKSLEENRLALEMLDRGAAKSGCDYQFGVEYGISAMMRPLGVSRGLAKRNAMRTALLAFDGKKDQAVDSLIAGLRLTRMFDREPILILHLVKIAILSLAVRDVQVVLNGERPTEAALARLQTAIEQAEQGIDLKRVYIAEQVYTLDVSRNLLSGLRELEPGPTGALRGEQFAGMLVLASPGMRTMAARELRLYGQVIAAADNDWPEATDEIRAMSAHYRPSIFERLMGVSDSPLGRQIVITCRAVACLRAASLAVMIERYRLKTGHLPESLAELQGAIGAQLPADPFTGKQMIYRKTADGYMVFSLGEDKKENPDQPLNEGGDSDCGVRVRLPG